MMRLSLRLLAGVSLCALVSGCDLPRGGARENEIMRSVAADNSETSVYAVTKAFLPVAASWPAAGPDQSYKWISNSVGSGQQIIAPGDKIALSVWDSGNNTLLSAPGQRVVELHDMTVSSRGTIFMPYVNDVKVSGLTQDTARAEVQRQISAVIPSAQVQVQVTSGRGNSVDLVGGVVSPANVPLPDRNFTILSLLSHGGGILPGIENPLVRLQRGGKMYAISAKRLYSEPDMDTVLRGGDKVIIDRDDRKFQSLGASGKEAVFPFTQDQITALQAMSMIGGLSDTRADPKGILILRNYPVTAVADGIRGPEHERTIFTIDLTTADGLFSAGRFLINPDDLVLVTETPISSFQTAIGLVTGTLNAGRIANNLAN
jgi:polysaccharide biosynthesis/export protein